MEVLLSFACAALQYLVTEELLVETHEGPRTLLIASMFFLGFLLLLVLTMISRVPAGAVSANVAR